MKLSIVYRELLAEWHRAYYAEREESARLREALERLRLLARKELAYRRGESDVGVPEWEWSKELGEEA